MSKQTAVEWMVEQVELISNNKTLSKKDAVKLYDEVIHQSKAMEKEQIEDAHIEGQRVFDNYQHTQWTTDQAEQYYNETYGGDK
jgi:hypothetical protein